MILQINIICFQCLFHNIFPPCNKFLMLSSSPCQISSQDLYFHASLLLLSSFLLLVVTSFFLLFLFASGELCMACCSSIVEDNTSPGLPIFSCGFAFGFLYHSRGSSLKGQSKFHLAMSCIH